MSRNPTRWSTGKLLFVEVFDARLPYSHRLPPPGAEQRKFTRDVRAGNTRVPVVMYVTREAVPPRSLAKGNLSVPDVPCRQGHAHGSILAAAACNKDAPRCGRCGHALHEAGQCGYHDSEGPCFCQRGERRCES